VVSATIASLIDQAVADYKAGDAAKGKEGVNDAYYKNYETTGMEKQVMARISGSRVSAVEMEFSLLKKAMDEGDGAGVRPRAGAGIALRPWNPAPVCATCGRPPAWTGPPPSPTRSSPLP